MPRRLLRQYLPHPERIRGQRFLQFLGKRLHQPNLWHLNRRSVSRGVAIGLFWAMIPMPFQMIPSAVTAIRASANLALAVVTVWISNPLTMPPIFFAQWALGQWLTGGSIRSAEGNMVWQRETWSSLDSFANAVGQVGLSLYLGSLISAVTLSLLGYLFIDRLWRWHVRRRWQGRGSRVRTHTG